MYTLIIDDDPTSIFVTTQLLRREGQPADVITSFVSPVEAVAFFRHLGPTDPLPQVVLLDLNMPLLNGWGVLEALKPLEAHLLGRCVFYILTSSLAPADTLPVRQYPLVAGVLHKPLDRAEIQSIQGQLLETRSLSASPMPQRPVVLLVDDDAATNYCNQRLLQQMQVSPEVLVASTAEDALAVLQARCTPSGTAACPTLILLDYNMPLPGGFGFLRAFTRLHPTLPQSFVVVLLTALPLAPDLVEAQHLPVTAVLTKPLTVESVDQLLHNYFGVPIPQRAMLSEC